MKLTKAQRELIGVFQSLAPAQVDEVLDGLRYIQNSLHVAPAANKYGLRFSASASLVCALRKDRQETERLDRDLFEYGVNVVGLS